MNTAISIAFWALLAYVLFWTSYDFLFAVASRFFRDPRLVKPQSDPTPTFTVLIPAYKEGEWLLETARRALTVDYPSDKFRVVVLAQSLDENLLSALGEAGADLVVTGGMGSKFNALKNFFASNEHRTSHIFVLDADNLISKNALRVAAAHLREGVHVVQLERKKTPPTTTFGILDRWNTAIGVQLANPSRMSLGVNPFLFGSGFASDYQVYETFVQTWPNTIVEDKFFDLFLGLEHKRLVYTTEGFVEDSTVQRSDVFLDQRKRWVGGRIEARNKARQLWSQHVFNFELLDKWLHYGAPQRSIILPISLLVYLVYVISFQGALAHFAGIGLLLLLGGIVLATPNSLWSVTLFKAILAIPQSVLSILKSRIVAKSTVKQDFKVTNKK